MKHAHIHITGIVQGVGMRPFVYRTAMAHGISGWVLNAGDGVHIEASAENASALDAFVRALRGLDVYEKMAHFSGHVCLFHGAKDGVVPLSYSERAAEAYPDSELIVFPEEGHGFSPQAMQDVNRRLLERIRSGLFFPSKK